MLPPEVTSHINYQQPSPGHKARSALLTIGQDLCSLVWFLPVPTSLVSSLRRHRLHVPGTQSTVSQPTTHTPAHFTDTQVPTRTGPSVARALQNQEPKPQDATSPFLEVLIASQTPPSPGAVLPLDTL